VLGAVVASLCVASSANAADRVYWANDGFTSPNRISYANLDGSGGGTLNTAGAPSGAPRGVAIDVAASRVYWTIPADGLAGNGQIAFASLDDSGGGGAVATTGALLQRPNAAAVYPAGGTIYWANEYGDTISFARLDNSGGGNLAISGATVNVPLAPMVDPTAGRIYWANAGSVNLISYANLDGSGGGNLNTAGATVDNPHGVAVDPVTQRIYWANVNGSPQRISYAHLNGSGGGDLNTAGATVSTPVGVAIDPAARRIYWANQVGNSISYANLDGGGGGNLPAPGATLSGSRSPVLLQAPKGTGAPAVTGGSRPGSSLTCSPGSWAGDLLGSWLLRAPQALAYSWTRNGEPIAGATGGTLSATRSGQYSCTVSASNPAGRATQKSAAHAVSAPAFGAKTLVTMKLAARRPPVRILVKNRNAFSVSGKLSAKRSRRAALKTRSFRVGATASKRVTLKLTKGARHALKRRGKLSLRLVAKVRDPAGNTRTVAKRISLRAKRR
jgi:hypothetical protein